MEEISIDNTGATETANVSSNNVGFLRRDLELDVTLSETNEVSQIFAATLPSAGGVPRFQDIALENLFS